MKKTENMNKRKTHKKRLVSLIAIFTLLIGCTSCKKETPREALEKAFDKTFSAESPVENLLGISKINEAINNNTPYSSGLSATIENISGELFGDYASLISGFGFSGDSALDIANKRYQSTLGISYGGTTYFTVGVHLDGSKLYLTVPQLLNGNISLDFSSLREDLVSDSFFGQLFTQLLTTYGGSLPEDFTLPENFSIDVWELFTTGDMNIDTTLPKNITDAYDEMNKQIVVEEIKKNEAKLPDGVSAKNVYTMTIPKKAYKDFAAVIVQFGLDSFFELLDDENLSALEELDMPDQEDIDDFLEDLSDTIGDIVLTVAVTKDGYISYMTSTLDIDGSTVDFSASFSGKKSPLEEVDVKVSAKIDGEKVSFSFTQKYDSDKKTATYNSKISAGDFTAKIAWEGEYSNVEKGKKYTFNLNYFECDFSEDMSFTISASNYMDITKCEISDVTGREYELLKMDQSALLGLVTEVMVNVQNDPMLSGLLGILGLE